MVDIPIAKIARAAGKRADAHGQRADFCERRRRQAPGLDVARKKVLQENMPPRDRQQLASLKKRWREVERLRARRDELHRKWRWLPFAKYVFGPRINADLGSAERKYKELYAHVRRRRSEIMASTAVREQLRRLRPRYDPEYLAQQRDREKRLANRLRDLREEAVEAENAGVDRVTVPEKPDLNDPSVIDDLIARIEDAKTAPKPEATATQEAATPSRSYWCNGQDGEPFGFVLTSTQPTPAPQGLFTSRGREEVPVLDAKSTVRDGYVRLPVPGNRDDVVTSAGGFVGQDGRLYAALSAIDEPGLIPYLPFIARPSILPLQTDLIPPTSWGSSLANLLTKSDWKRVRRPYLEAYGHTCFICGRAGEPIECHELWEYHEPSNPEHVGVQRLFDMLPLCHECHEIFHMGLAQVNNRLETAQERLRLINRWDQAEVEAARDWISDNVERRSGFQWVLDLSLISDVGPIKIAGNWQRAEDGILYRYLPNLDMETVTLPLGVSFKFANEAPTPAIDPDEAYRDM